MLQGFELQLMQLMKTKVRGIQTSAHSPHRPLSVKSYATSLGHAPKRNNNSLTHETRDCAKAQTDCHDINDTCWTMNGKSEIHRSKDKALLADPLESAAVDLLQICHIRQHLVAQGAPDARTTGKGSGILCSVGGDERVDACVTQSQGALWGLGTVLLACT